MSETTTDNGDTLNFGSGITDDLIIDIVGGSDQLTVANWFNGAKLESITTADGHSITDTQVNALVDAMSAFARPADTDTSLSAQVHQALDTTIAAAWHTAA